MPQYSFEFDFSGFNVKGDKYSNNCNTVILHGAGKSSRARFKKLRHALNQKGLSSMSFDFVGHGESEGELINSSLEKRFEQAKFIIKQQSPDFSTLIASSMSAYTAIKLTEIFPIKNLILMVPAVYTSKAYTLTFGSSFSKTIREENSWLDSDAFTILKEFKGNLLILAAQNDEVIPPLVLERIYSSASSAKSKKLHIVPNGEHRNLFPKTCDFDLGLDLIHTMSKT